jgi:autotransporter-associated beta strand protein
MKPTFLRRLSIPFLASSCLACGQALEPKSTLWSNTFQTNTVGQSTGASPAVINGFRFNFPGGIIRDSSVFAPFGPDNLYLELSPNNNVANPGGGYRTPVNAVLKAQYIATPVGVSFDFNESTATGFATVIGFATGTTDSNPDVNAGGGLFALQLDDGLISLGANTSTVEGTLPAFTQGTTYRITYITNFTNDTHTVRGPDGETVDLQSMQGAFWMYDPVLETYTDRLVIANNNSRALDAHVQFMFRHFSASLESQRQTIYVDNLLATNFAEPIPTWVGNGSDALWSSAENWSNNLVPAANDSIIFTGALNLTPDNDLTAGTGFTDISFEGISSSFTLTGNGIELLGALSNSSSVNQTVGLPLLLNSTQTITNNTAGTHLYLDGLVSGGGGVSKTGAGTVALGNSNTYSGGTTITGTGALNSHALEVVQLANGGLPSSLGSSSSSAANLTLNGGELRYTGTGDTTDRLFTLAANSYVMNNGDGALTYSNTAAIEHTSTGTTRTLNLGGTFTASPNVFAPQITDTGDTGLTGLTVRGGTWAVSGNNTFTGNMTINFGAKASIQSDSNLGAGSGTGKFTLAGTLICTENLTLNSDRGIYAGSPTAAGNAIIEVAETKTVIHNGFISNNLGGSAIGADALTKSGLGTLALGGANTYAGTTTVLAGTLSLGADGSFDSSPTISVRADATLDLSAKTAAFPILATQTLTGAGTAQGQSLAVAGNIAPGTAGIGTLSTDAVAMAADASLTIQINSAAATSDTLAVNGNLTLNAETTLSLADIAAAPEIIPNGSKLTLATYTGILSGTFKDLPENSAVLIGDNEFNLSYADGSAITLTSTNEVSADPFVAWIDSFLTLTAPADKEKTADPDGDGRSNFEEFAFDGDPTNPGSDGKTQSSLALVESLKYLTLTIPVRDAAVFTGSPALTTAAVDGLVYGFRGSFDLSGFTAGVVEVSPAITTTPPLNPGWSYRSFRLSASSSDQPRGFLRAEVTPDSP